MGRVCVDNPAIINSPVPVIRESERNKLEVCWFVVSVAVGIFFGIIPIWGYQLITAIAAAYLLKLNKAIVIVAANISIPVLLPVVLYCSLKVGELVTGISTALTLKNISLQNIESNIYIYIIGACVLSVVFAIFMGLVTYIYVSLVRSKKLKMQNKIAEWLH